MTQTAAAPNWVRIDGMTIGAVTQSSWVVRQMLTMFATATVVLVTTTTVVYKNLAILGTTTGVAIQWSNRLMLELLNVWIFPKTTCHGWKNIDSEKRKKIGFLSADQLFLMESTNFDNQLKQILAARGYTKDTIIMRFFSASRHPLGLPPALSSLIPTALPGLVYARWITPAESMSSCWRWSSPWRRTRDRWASMLPLFFNSRSNSLCLGVLYVVLDSCKTPFFLPCRPFW